LVSTVGMGADFIQEPNPSHGCRFAFGIQCSVFRSYHWWVHCTEETGLEQRENHCRFSRTQGPLFFGVEYWNSDWAWGSIDNVHLIADYTHYPLAENATKMYWQSSDDAQSSNLDVSQPEDLRSDGGLWTELMGGDW